MNQRQSNRVRGRQFRALGMTHGFATPASTQRWFVTAHSTRTLFEDGQFVEVPASLAHAKEMGGTVTACGLSALSWPRLFHLSFPPPVATMCLACAEVAV